jgi:hypothetical protein
LSVLVVHELPAEVPGLRFYDDKVVLFLFFGQGEDVVNRAVAFSAEAEKAGIVGERDVALERPNHPSTNDIEEIVF